MHCGQTVQCGLRLLACTDLTANMAEVVEPRRAARGSMSTAVRRIEGDLTYEREQEFFAVAARVAKENRLSRFVYGGSRCSGKIRSALSASLRAQLSDNDRRPPENIPTSPCAPIYPPQNRLLSRVTSYVSRRPLPRLHLAWLDTSY